MMQSTQHDHVQRSFLELLSYVDSLPVLEEMRRVCEEFVWCLTERDIGKFPPLSYRVEIDVLHLLDKCVDLAELLVQEPVRFHSMLSELMYACLQTVVQDSYGHSMTFVKLSQVQVTIRLKCVPSILVVPNCHYYNGLVSVQGLMVAVTKPESYITHSVWTCPEVCDGNELILHRLPNHAPKCYQCKTRLFENSRLRRCGERVLATVSVKGRMPKQVLIADDLIKEIILCNQYTIIGVIFGKYLHAWSLERIGVMSIHAPMPHRIDKLSRKCKAPWKFIYCLASTLGATVCPVNAFMHLKINLLLSLASLKCHASAGTVHVLATGLDTRFVPDLMSEAAKYADRSVFVGSQHSSMPDALLASSDGVCVVSSPLNTYSNSLAHGILTAIEKDEILVDKANLRVKSAVWAHGADHKQFRINNFASVFGTVCRGDHGDHDSDTADFLLQNAIQGGVQLEAGDRKASTDLRKLLELVAGLEIQLEESAERLLRDYFVSARKDGQGGVRCVTALARLCAASARLCCRSSADEDDAVLAIWLHVSGCAEPRSAPAEYLDTPVDIKQLEVMMGKFKMWLGTYIA